MQWHSFLGVLDYFENEKHKAERPEIDRGRECAKLNWKLEIKNGDFIYRDTFFVELDDGKRHPRAAVSELKELLMPKKGHTPAKDQTARFYEAQLVHYGLSRVKDKNAAKVRLIAALNADSLVVPSHIQKVESDAKKAYGNAQRNARAAAKKEQEATPTNVSTSKKRRAPEVEESKGSNSKITIKVGDIAVEIDHKAIAKAQAAAKKHKTTTTTTKAKPAAKPPAKHTVAKKTDTKAPKSPATKKARPATTTSPLATSQSAIGNHPRPKQTARRARPFNHSAERATVDREPTPMSLCTDDEEDPFTYSYQVSESVVPISGSYELRQTSTTPDGVIYLWHSQARNEIWGRIEIGSKFGILQIRDISGITSQQSKSFGWRSEDEETGEFRFGRGCDGWIELDGQGGVRGAFYKLMKVNQDVEFVGQLLERFNWESDYMRDGSVQEVVALWDGFPGRAYRRT